LERHRQAGAVLVDGPVVFDPHVLLHDLGDAHVTQGLRRCPDGGGGCVPPRLLARANHLAHIVDAFPHGPVLSGWWTRQPRRGSCGFSRTEGKRATPGGRQMAIAPSSRRRSSVAVSRPARFASAGTAISPNPGAPTRTASPRARRRAA